MLAGHNRTNAAKIAGLSEVPAIVKTDLSDEDAYVYVIETNLLQRSFAELLPSEKAAVLVARYEKISSQGKRNDIRQEIERLEKEEKRLSGELARVNGMLNNERFMSKAPEDKVAEEREKLVKYTQMMEQVKERLAQLRK